MPRHPPDPPPLEAARPVGVSSSPARWVWALIFGVTLLAYFPALQGGLIWDDAGHVTRPDLQSLRGLTRIWSEVGATQQYYPVLHTAFWLEHRLWGDSPLGYHLLNVLLHATAAVLVVVIVRRLFNGESSPSAPPRGGVSGSVVADHERRRYAGAEWLAGLIFALHPVCVESVAWISEQKNTLSAVFCLGAALAYLGFDRDRRPSRYWLALGLFVLALLTKTVTATLPAALLVIFWWERGRLSWARDARPLLPWFALGGVGGLFSAWFERTLIGAHGADFSLTALERCLLAGRVIWFYLGKLVWPADLVFIYPRWVVDAKAWWQYLFPLGVVAVVAGLGLLARRHRGPLARAATAGLAGFLTFAGMLFPVLGFVDVYPFVFSYVADHFQYLASLGIIIPVAAGLTLATKRILPLNRQLIRVGTGVLLAGLGVLTWRQSSIYRDAQTLYRETLARNPNCSMAHNNLGLILSQIPGRMPEAIDHYEAAVRSNPRNVEAHLNLGYALVKTPGRFADAISEYEMAVRIAPGNAEAHDNLGVALSQIPGRMPEALAQLEAAAEMNPRSAEIQGNLGAVLAKTPGRLPDAIAHFEAAVRIDPGSAKARSNLGNALALVPGRLPEAIQQLEAAARMDPRSANAHHDLGRSLLRVPERLPAAIEQFEIALRIDPNSAEAHNDLGVALLQMPGRSLEAIEHLKAAIRINPELVEAHYVLGIALSASPGREEESRAQIEAALRLNPGFKPAQEWIEQLRAARP